MIRLHVAALLILASAGCAGPRRYTSLDLALLPCESGMAPVFFRPLEFDPTGEPLFKHQVDALHERLRRGTPVTDLIFFVHGWNKNPSSAEVDYQNFLCRLHGRLRNVIGEEKRQGGLLVVGIFWPSTITNDVRDPVHLKPVSYYRMRARADDIAVKGLAPLLASLEGDLRARRGGLPVRLQLVGHSFGGRMIVRALQQLQEDGRLPPLLQAAGTVNVVLLNGAVPPERFDWLSKAVVTSKAQGTPARMTDETDSYLFNVHSFHDLPNRVLFRVASVFNDDPSTCAAGACGVPEYVTVCIDDAGRVRKDLPRPAGDSRPERGPLNAWNVDATSIVFDHSDIYKGRIATLIADLLYDENTKKALPRGSAPAEATEARCRE